LATKEEQDGASTGKPSEINETVDLLKRYVVQETLDPLKRIGRILGYGLGGALALTIGLILLVVAVLRLLQEETGTAFAGTWSFAPYLVAAALVIVLIGLAAFAAVRRRPGRSAAPR
jgi:hypothetical protein